MGRNRLFKKYVNAALVRLRVEKTVHRLQAGLFVASFSAVLILLISRMFVLPYYGRFAVVTACAVLIATLIISIYKRIQKAEAVRQLDNFIPENLLITAVSLKEDDSLLATAIIEEADLKLLGLLSCLRKGRKRM